MKKLNFSGCELDGPTRNALLDRTPKVQAHGQGTIDSSLCCRASSQRLSSNTGPEGTLRSEDKEVVRASPICSIREQYSVAVAAS